MKRPLTSSLACMLLFCLTAYCVALAVTPEYEIVPGQRLGKICLGDSPATVRKKVGTPNFSDQEDGYVVESFGSPKKNDMIGVFYRNGKVVQIGTFYPTYKTKEGIGRGSSWFSLKKHYPHLKTFSLGDKKDYPEEVRNYYVSKPQGVAFLLDNAWPPVANKDTSIFLVMVFDKNVGPVVNDAGKLRILK